MLAYPEVDRGIGIRVGIPPEVDWDTVTKMVGNPTELDAVKVPAVTTTAVDTGATGVVL